MNHLFLEFEDKQIVLLNADSFHEISVIETEYSELLDQFPGSVPDAGKITLDSYKILRKLIFRYFHKAGEDIDRKLYAVRIKILTGGVSGTIVLYCTAYDHEHDDPFQRKIIKYGNKESIETEYENYSVTAGVNSSVAFPDYSDVITDGAEGTQNGSAILVMSSVHDAQNAKDAYSVVDYFLMHYRENPGQLAYFGDRIGEALQEAYRSLIEIMYIREKSRSFLPSDGDYHIQKNTKSIIEYLQQKVGYSQLADTGMSGFSKRYDLLSSLIAEEVNISVPNPESYFEVPGASVPMLSCYAVHGDYNPNNLILTVDYEKERIDIRSTIIDLFDVKYRRKEDVSLKPGSGMKSPDYWVPLFWDAARMEMELLVRFFHEARERNRLNLSELKNVLDGFLEALNSGDFITAGSRLPQRIADREIDYLFRTIYRHRQEIFTNKRLAEVPGWDTESAFINFQWALFAFSFFYLKFEKEESIEEKRKISLLVGLYYRKMLKEKRYSIDPDRFYKPTKWQRLGGRLNQSELVMLTKRYVPLQDTVKAILDAITTGDADIILVEGQSGSGKSSMLAYLARLINSDIVFPEMFERFNLNIKEIICIPILLRVNEKSDDLIERIISETKDFQKSGPSTESNYIQLLVSFMNSLVPSYRPVLFLDDAQSFKDLQRFLSAALEAGVPAVLFSWPDEAVRDTVTSLGSSDVKLKSFLMGPIQEHEVISLGRVFGLTIDAETANFICHAASGYPIIVKTLFEDLQEEIQEHKITAENVKKRLRDEFEKVEKADGLHSKVVLHYKKVLNSVDRLKDIQAKKLAYKIMNLLTVWNFGIPRGTLRSLAKFLFHDIPSLSRALGNALNVLSPFINISETGNVEFFHSTVPVFWKNEFRGDLEDFQEDLLFAWLRSDPSVLLVNNGVEIPIFTLIKKSNAEYFSRILSTLIDIKGIEEILSISDNFGNSILHLAAENDLEIYKNVIYHIENKNDEILKIYLTMRNRKQQSVLELLALKDWRFFKEFIKNYSVPGCSSVDRFIFSIAIEDFFKLDFEKRIPYYLEGEIAVWAESIDGRLVWGPKVKTTKVKDPYHAYPGVFVDFGDIPENAIVKSIAFKDDYIQNGFITYISSNLKKAYEDGKEIFHEDEECAITDARRKCDIENEWGWFDIDVQMKMKPFGSTNLTYVRPKVENTTEIVTLVEGSIKMGSYFFNRLGSMGDSILHFACRNGDKYFIVDDYLKNVQQGFEELKIKNTVGDTPLHIAASRQPELLKYIFEKIGSRFYNKKYVGIKRCKWEDSIL